MLVGRLRELAYLNEGVRIRLVDERTDKKETFQYDKGLVAFVEHLNEGKATLHAPILIHKEDTDTRLLVDIVAQYADVLQVGSRNMHQSHLLKTVGRQRKPVLLKRLRAEWDRYAKRVGVVPEKR